MFSDWLFKELEKRNMSQADLARATGITRGGISNLLNQVRHPDPETCNAIAHALKLPPETVFRAAGLLPPKPDHDQKLDEALHLLSMLPDDDIQEILDLLRVKLDRKTVISAQSRPKAARMLLKGK